MFNKKNHIKSLISAIICSVAAQAALATNIDRIVAFGDSLSDNGNIYSMTQKASKAIPMIPIIPKNPPYYDGRFSNGPVWLEDLAVAMDVPLTDHAYGGSWAEPLLDSGLVFPFSLGMQVNMYMVENVLDYHQADHLFVIWTGANDYIDKRDDLEYATDNTIANIKKQIDWLIYYGGTHFFIPNLPDISVSPEVVKQGPEAVRTASEVVDMHNRKLDAMLLQEKQENPDVDFITVDITARMDEIIANPDKYNLKNIKDACYGGGYWLQGLKANDAEVAAAKKANIDLTRTPALRIAYQTAKAAAMGAQSCSNPDQYMFWDQLHPTRTMHLILAKEALQILHDHNIFGSSSDKFIKSA